MPDGGFFLFYKNFFLPENCFSLMAKMIYSLKINENIYFRDQIELSTFFFFHFSVT